MQFWGDAGSGRNNPLASLGGDAELGKFLALPKPPKPPPPPALARRTSAAGSDGEGAGDGEGESGGEGRFLSTYNPFAA